MKVLRGRLRNCLRIWALAFCLTCLLRCVVLLGGFQMRQLDGWSDVMAEGELFRANEMPLDIQSGISRREDMLDYRETRRGMMARSAGKKKPIFASL